MSSRFLQGEGYPTLYRYNSSNVLQETVAMPYVRDDGNRSFVQQFIEPYPPDEIRQHRLLSGDIEEDPAQGYIIQIKIKYSSIEAAKLKDIYNCILTSRYNSGDYLKLKPRSDFNTADNVYKVVFIGKLELRSKNMWQHNILLEFKTSELLSANLSLEIPPITP